MGNSKTASGESVAQVQGEAPCLFSDEPIIVKRSMYFDYNGWKGGHDVAGYAPQGGRAGSNPPLRYKCCTRLC